MKKGITLLILVFLLAVGYSLMGAPAKPSAQPQAVRGFCTLSKDLGTYRGTAMVPIGNGRLSVVFEEANGRLTFWDMGGCLAGKGFLNLTIAKE